MYHNEPLCQCGIRLLLGALFIYASIHKIVDPESFAVSIYNYKILPFGLINITAVVLPWLELLIGICLVFRLWYLGALFLVDLLLLIFFSALIFSFIRGIDIDCGCFAAAGEGRLAVSMAWYLMRDGLLLFLGLFLFFRVYSDRREACGDKGESQIRRNQIKRIGE